MSIHINLSPELEGFIQSKVAGGAYSSEAEVIGDAVKRMQTEDAKVEALLAAIHKGEEDFEEGRWREYTPELLEELSRQASLDVHSGKPIDPDVLP